MDEEGLRETANQLIHIGQPINMDDEAFCRQLAVLEQACQSNSPDIRHMWRIWCPRITPKQIKEHKSIPLAFPAKGMLFA